MHPVKSILISNVKDMWIFSKRQNVWVNLNMAQRISKDGSGGYIITCVDGTNTIIDQDTYDECMRWVDPNWYDKHPDGRKDSLDIQEALKAIIKATNAKIEEKKEKEEG